MNRLRIPWPNQRGPGQTGPIPLIDENSMGATDRRAPLAWLGNLLRRLVRNADPARRLTLLERVPLGPRQCLWLVEAEGTRLLIASSAQGGVTFFALEAGSEAVGEGGGPRSREFHSPSTKPGRRGGGL